MIIKRISPFSSNINAMDIDITEEQYEAWAQGKLIQDVMPNITADEREFILTGILKDEWNKLFGEENE